MRTQGPPSCCPTVVAQTQLSLQRASPRCCWHRDADTKHIRAKQIHRVWNPRMEGSTSALKKNPQTAQEGSQNITYNEKQHTGTAPAGSNTRASLDTLHLNLKKGCWHLFLLFLWLALITCDLQKSTVPTQTLHISKPEHLQQIKSEASVLSVFCSVRSGEKRFHCRYKSRPLFSFPLFSFSLFSFLKRSKGLRADVFGRVRQGSSRSSGNYQH